ncbi:MAG: D-alanyl-D-alanine carboxypeptidase [Firmicutes bacterium]|nr:D-alanyl-D-alanine carboxypeptidase [Bacillota bacterium]
MKTHRKKKQGAEPGRRQETEPGAGQKAAGLLITVFVILILALSALAIWKVLTEASGVNGAGFPAVKGEYAAAKDGYTAAKPEPGETAPAIAAPSVSAGAAILIDAEDGTVLYEKNADQKMYPASTTKIMTALVVLETLEELELGLDSEIIVPAEAQGVEGSSLYLKAGERMSVEELLYGLMLQSGNDSAVALAACVGGSAEHFVDQMNQRAAELGCRGTHFVNPNGLYDAEHYTNARDLAYIAREAMKREDFRKIVGSQRWSSEGSSARTFVNKNKTVFQYEGGDGVKIGFTKASGRTLVSSASRDGHRVIAVVLNDGNWFQDAYALMDFGFSVLETSKH